MRLVLVMLVSVAVCLSLCSCGDSENPCECSGEGTVALVWATYEDDYWDVTQESRSDSTEVSGVILADVLPTWHSVDLNEEEFSGPSYWSYLPGYITFGGWDRRIIIGSGLDQIDVAVHTSAGTVAGTVTLPDEIADVELSESEVLELGEPLTVSWFGHEADFYYFSLAYEWGDGWEYAHFDTVLYGNSVTIDGSFFSHDGIIWDIHIEPLNGPPPRLGATGNMSGHGSGYLYYSGESYWAEDEIQVGDGLEWREKGTISRSPEACRMKSQAMIQRMLGLPVQNDG